jgi:stalled ribosome alternative rescue factor ArfA
MNQKKQKLDKRIFKKSPEELEQYLHFKRRGFTLENKRGKGSYSRKEKHKNDYRNQDCV